MTTEQGKVYIVDDDEAVRKSLQLLLKTVGIESEVFASGDDFLHEYDSDWRGCIVLDIRMPGTSGMEVHKILQERANHMPIIFMTGHGDVPMAVDAMRLGAYDFVQKPFPDQELVDRINRALMVNRENAEEELQAQQVLERFNKLTPREHEVMECVVRGLANKVIAMDLDVSQRTVEIHRARVMEKMQVRSLAELVRIAILLEE